MLLAIDTSTRQIGVAVYDGGGAHVSAARVLSEMTWTSPFHHTVDLAPAVELSLQRAGVSMDDLEAIGIAVGPGSFTALRTGLAFAKGVVLARGLPLAGIPTLDILAGGQPEQDLPILAVLEAGRRRLACLRYRTGESGRIPDGTVELLSAAALNERLLEPAWVCGELDAEAQSLLAGNPHARLAPAAFNIRRPAVLAELAWARWKTGDTDDPAGLAPQYLSTAGIDT